MAKAQESLEEREKEGASIKEEPYIEIKKYGKNRGYICRVQEIHTKKLMLILDSLLINFAYFGSLMLRFDGNIPQLYLDYYVKSFFLVTIIVLLCFYKFDIYDRLWRFASTNEMFSILSATTIASLLMLGFTYMLRFLYPRSIYLLFWLLLTALISGYRFMLRVFFSHSMNSAQKGKSDAINVMIIGAGDAASVVVEEFLRHPGLKRRPIVLIDDNKNKHGMKIRECR